MRNILWYPIIARLISWIFARMSFLVPISRLHETSNLIAFQHPSPSYEFHVLIVPKREAASLAELNPADTAFLSDLYSTVQSLVDEFHLRTYRLIVNGGAYRISRIYISILFPTLQVKSQRSKVCL